MLPRSCLWFLYCCHLLATLPPVLPPCHPLCQLPRTYLWFLHFSHLLHTSSQGGQLTPSQQRRRQGCRPQLRMLVQRRSQRKVSWHCGRGWVWGGARSCRGARLEGGSRQERGTTRGCSQRLRDPTPHQACRRAQPTVQPPAQAEWPTCTVRCVLPHSQLFSTVSRHTVVHGPMWHLQTAPATQQHQQRQQRQEQEWCQILANKALPEAAAAATT